MIHEQETREVVMLVFRAVKFGEAELLKAIQAECASYAWQGKVQRSHANGSGYHSQSIQRVRE